MATKKCPYCGEEILVEAKKCKHCGEWLGESEEPSAKQSSYSSGNQPYEDTLYEEEEEGFFAHHLVKNLNPLFQFSGKLGRKDYWLGSLVLFAVFCSIALSLLFLCMSGFLSLGIVKAIFVLLGILSIPFVIVSLGMSVRRLHDIGKSEWLVFLGYIPIANLYFLYLMCQKGEAESGETTHKPVDYACWAAILLCPIILYFIGNQGEDSSDLTLDELTEQLQTDETDLGDDLNDFSQDNDTDFDEETSESIDSQELGDNSLYDLLDSGNSDIENPIWKKRLLKLVGNENYQFMREQYMGTAMEREEGMMGRYETFTFEGHTKENWDDGYVVSYSCGDGHEHLEVKITKDGFTETFDETN